MDVNRIREDFPLYDSNKRSIFLDSACQTLRPRQVIDAVVEYYEKFPTCGGRSSYRMAMQVQQKCEETRDRFAEFIGSNNSGEISFTKNATEGINIVLFGKKWERGDEIICTDHEHNSVLIPLITLAKRNRAVIRRVRSFPDGNIDLEHLKEIAGKKTKLLAMCHTSNITGNTIPVREVAEIAHDVNAEFLLDGAQSVPHRRIKVDETGVDYLSFSVHKMCGPSGMGILYGKFELLDRLEPIIYGGMSVSDSKYESANLLGPPQKFEPGLQNYSGIFGAEAALRYIQQIGIDEIHEHELSLNRRLIERIAGIDDIIPLLPYDSIDRGGIFSFNIKDTNPHDIAFILDSSHNIMIRSGNHCCHSWFHSRNIEGCARSSLYLYNNAEDIDAFTDAIKDIACN